MSASVSVVLHAADCVFPQSFIVMDGGGSVSVVLHVFDCVFPQSIIEMDGEC